MGKLTLGKLLLLLGLGLSLTACPRRMVKEEPGPVPVLYYLTTEEQALQCVGTNMGQVTVLTCRTTFRDQEQFYIPAP